jgi:hypothetical protein
MDDQVLLWLRELDGPPGLDPAAATAAARARGLPPEYAEFLREHNGAEGFIGESYVRFYGTAELADEADSPPLDHLAELLVFGTNGAGEAFACDVEVQVFVVSWIGSERDAVPQATFEQFIGRLRDGRMFERD